MIMPNARAAGFMYCHSSLIPRADTRTEARAPHCTIPTCHGREDDLKSEITDADHHLSASVDVMLGDAASAAAWSSYAGITAKASNIKTNSLAQEYLFCGMAACSIGMRARGLYRLILSSRHRSARLLGNTSKPPKSRCIGPVRRQLGFTHAVTSIATQPNAHVS